MKKKPMSKQNPKNRHAKSDLDRYGFSTEHREDQTNVITTPNQQKVRMRRHYIHTVRISLPRQQRIVENNRYYPGVLLTIN